MDRAKKLHVLGQGSEHEQDGHPVTSHRPPTSRYGVYYAKSPRGSVPLVRTMMTSSCAMHCGYCPFGLDVNRNRATWKGEELVKTVLELRDAGIAEGLFLTSGLAGNAVRMMDRMLDAVKLLRAKHAYTGYVHLKLLPGIEDAQLEEALRLADRVSINLEAPTDLALARIAPEKSLSGDLATRLGRAATLLREGRPSTRAGLVTQFMVGPGGETDRTLLQAVERLYQRYRVRRAYYSAFTPILGTPMEGVEPESPLREVRLYQADWLLRFYGFQMSELPLDAQGALPRDRDPKTAWALAQPKLFPLEINKAPKELLLRVPGLGPKSVERILHARRLSRVRTPEDLERLGVRTRRALGFLLLDGKHWPGLASTVFGVEHEQLELFRYPRGFGRLANDRRRIDPSRGGTYL